MSIEKRPLRGLSALSPSSHYAVTPNSNHFLVNIITNPVEQTAAVTVVLNWRAALKR